MGTLEERVAALETQLAELTARLDQTPAPPAAPEETFWALDALRQRLPAGTGGVVYTGVVEAAPGERFEWQYGASTDELLTETDWSPAAATLAALGHSVRLLLLREILQGRRTAAELTEVEGLGTTGQLYHHLRALSGAGWLRTTGRGHYSVPPERVVPLLVVLTAARR
ncbi:winged helix-turn-helix transcriptional regulator [Natronosporangium hydrolyticum]|uniref:Winged helix-turn-helix transcriptional regulator n=1 Tax=Natronosporangium hydrolyticum TaxID=2811111 RepID=A0A895Y5X9_9ACTN|nr:winged helix-turn-helix domain-containing protein [Natronosporangium hydrolyticum]QSB13137.1 winged helix-turn-helix transcriptional regulator [Natronosporangium hydrolyticum]